MTYLLLNPPDPELAKLLRERFPTAFGGRRLVEDSARHADGSDRREPLRDSLMPQAA
ncbi:MAG: hypothetical protein WBM75_10585 [Polyangiales bacterium]